MRWYPPVFFCGRSTDRFGLRGIQRRQTGGTGYRTMASFLYVMTLLLVGHVVSSARARDKVELRTPRQEDKKIAPSPEDRHKYIHDGVEYDRPPNLFDVGDGELKLLPEVMSELSFEVRDFKDDGTTAEQKELRDSRYWGRLHVDGWPAPIQYLRSHFGGPATEGMQLVVLADPLDACEPLRNADSAGSALVIATRGKCTYTAKVTNAQHASANALLIVNNEDGLLHPPGPDGKALEMFSGMIPQAEGGALIEAVRDQDPPARGALVPMNCNKNSGIGSVKNQQCHAAVKADRDLVDSLTMGGFLYLPGGGKFEYLLAEFGAMVPTRELELGTFPSPPSACVSPTEDAAAAAAGKVVIAPRGECSFIEKAEAVDGGPSERVGALIVTNTETSLFRMGASPRWRGAKVPFATVLVSDTAGRELSTLPAGSVVRFAPSDLVTVAAWNELGRLREASAWPKGEQDRRSMLETLVSDNAGYPDRVSAVRAAFSRVAGGKENGGMREGEVGDDGEGLGDGVDAPVETSVKL